MKKYLVLLLLFIGIPAVARAQNFTAVTATVLDPNGIAYANGTITFTLVNSGGTASFASTPSIGSSTIAGYVGPVSLSSSGTLSVNLASNAVLTPAGTLWIPTVCASPVELPLGTGSQCFTTAGISISGSTQDISATINASALALTTKANLARVYNTRPTEGTSSISATTMVTAPSIPATGTTYRFAAYASETVVGTSCAANTTVVVNLIWQDPNEASPATTANLTYTITTNGSLGRLIPAVTNALPVIRAKAGTVVQFSTTYTAGGSCSPAPTVQIYPILEQM